MKTTLRPLLLGALLAAATLGTASAGDLAKQLEGKLVKRDGDKVVAAENALEGKKHIAVYYSAHWCPPCRKFTPELSKFYDEAVKEHPDFQLVFVSSDKDEKAMEEYLEWGEMNYPAVKFDQVAASGLKKHAARGIPYLIVLDANGKELIAKAEGEDWRSPAEVLDELKKLLEKAG